MRKNIILIIAILIIIFIIGFIIYFSIDKSKDSSIEVESTEKTKLDALKEILSNSNYFETSKLVSDTENNKITIDEKYDVYIKNGYYMMNIKDEKDEVSRILKEEMENAVSLRVPLVADVHFGKNWYEAK